MFGSLMHLALLDEPRSGPENMAIDQAMLDLASAQGRCLLRLYEWSVPTLSLGYFQKHSDRLAHGPSSQLEMVRRKTGGGAIVHHHDWTYSVAIPERLLTPRAETAGSSQVGAAEPLYRSVHQAVVDCLTECGVAARRWQQDSQCQTSNDATPGCSFLCFERRASGDVVCGAHKLMGSAQRRQRGAVLQHGSLLLRSSEFAPSLQGLAEVAEWKQASPSGDCGPLNRRVFFERLCAAVESFLEEELQVVSNLQDMLPAPVDAHAFRDEAWTRKR